MQVSSMRALWIMLAYYMLGVLCREQHQEVEKREKLLQDLVELTERELLEATMKDKKAIRCQPGETACDMKGNDGCISQAQYCDGKADCPDGSDESMCALLCGKFYAQMTQAEWEAGYYCESDRKCIYERQRCDGVRDCPGDLLEETAALGCGKKNLLRELIEEYMVSRHR